jgi:hypothetical protein
MTEFLEAVHALRWVLFALFVLYAVGCIAARR